MEDIQIQPDINNTSPFTHKKRNGGTGHNSFQNPIPIESQTFKSDDLAQSSAVNPDVYQLESSNHMVTSGDDENDSRRYHNVS